MAMTAMTTAPISSSVATMTFPVPAVVMEDFVRRATVEPCTSPAIPPPAISARVHFRKGEGPCYDAVVMFGNDRGGVAMISRI
jgi:hypothetical protein